MTDKPFERTRRRSLIAPPSMSEDTRTMHQVDDDEDTTNQKQYSDVTIVLLGKTGSGKSSTGNRILNNDAFKMNSSFRSATVESERCYRDLDGRTITVIDTPGPFDTHSKEKVKEKVKEQIEVAMKLAYPGVHVFLLVIRLDVKFTEEERNSVKCIVETLGEEVRKHTIVLFTHGNELKEKTIEQFIHEAPELSHEVASMAGYHVFENEQRDNNETQVTELQEKIDALKIKNKNQMYTTEMYEKMKSTSFGMTDVKEITGTAGIVGGGVGAAMYATGQGETASVIAGAIAGVITAVALGIKKKIKK